MQEEPLDPFAGDPTDPTSALEDDGPGRGAQPLTAEERQDVLDDLADLDVYEALLTARDIRGLVVDCEEELQIRRLQARDGSTLEQARAILNAQTSRSARLKAAHDVIKNDGDMSAVRDQVAALHTRYLELAQQART